MNILRKIREVDKALNEGRISYQEAADMVAPFTDAEPIKHGKWIVIKDEDGSTMSCSECGLNLGRVDCDLTPMTEIWQYCPHCGAKMGE